MVGWHHRLSGHESELTLGDSEGQGSVVGYSPRGCKELGDRETEQQEQLGDGSPQSHYIVAIQLLSHVPLFATSWTAACQVSLSSTISLSLLKLVFTVSVMPSNHLIICHPLLLLPSALHIRWPRDWSFSLSISPSSEYSGLISLRKLKI